MRACVCLLRFYFIKRTEFRSPKHGVSSGRQMSAVHLSAGIVSFWLAFDGLLLTDASLGLGEVGRWSSF